MNYAYQNFTISTVTNSEMGTMLVNNSIHVKKVVKNV